MTLYVTGDTVDPSTNVVTFAMTDGSTVTALKVSNALPYYRAEACNVTFDQSLAVYMYTHLPLIS